MALFRSGSLVASLLLLFAFASLPGTANAEEETHAAIFEAVRAELRGGAWALESVTLGERDEENRGIMTAVRQHFTASVRARVPRFREVEATDDYLFLDMVADPDRSTPLEGEATLLTGPGVSEVEIAFANPRMVRSPGQILASLPIRDRIVLIVGTPEADEAMARLAEARQAEMTQLMDAFGGEWAGMRSCSNGSETEIRLSFERGEQHLELAGTLGFQEATYQRQRGIFGAEGAHGLPRGRYTVTGRYMPQNGQLRLQAQDWLERQAGANFLSPITLTVGDAPAGEPALDGTDRSGACEYRLIRPEAFAAEREPLLAPFRAMLDAIEIGTWIEGSQIGPVDDRRDGQREWPLRVRVDAFSDYFVAMTVEMMTFRRNNGAAVREAEVQLLFLLSGGTGSLNVRFGPEPRVGTQLRNVYASNRCPGRLAFEEDTLIILGIGAENPACVEEIRLPLVPQS